MAESAESPKGAWTGSVTYDGQVDDYTATFDENGSLSMTTKRSTGSGTWSPTGSDTFRFTVKEYFNHDVTQISPTGKHVEYIQIDFDARRTGPTYSGSGTAVVYGTDGSVVYSTKAETTARQES